MAIAWLLHRGVTSVLIVARNTAQLLNSLGALEQVDFLPGETDAIEAILAGNPALLG